MAAMGAEVKAGFGSRNATAVTSGFSDTGQQDIEQFTIPSIVCPQSMSECGEIRFFW
jgi:hypothetical protein